MAPIVIDLTSSPEPEDSPGKAARSALNNFQPRSQKANISRPKDEQKRSFPHAVPSAFGRFETQKDTRSPSSNGKTGTSSIPISRPLLAGSTGAPLRNEGLNGTGTARDPQPTPSALHRAGANYHAHPPNRSTPSNPTGATPSNDQPIRRPGGLGTPTNLLAPHRATPPVSKVAKAPVEVINIDDDSDTTSSSSDSELPPIDSILKGELDGIRPFKKRRIDGPAEGNYARATEQRQHGPSIAAARHSDGGGDTLQPARTPSINGLPIRPTPPLANGKTTTAQPIGNRDESEQIRAIRAGGLKIGLPFAAERTSTGSASVQSRAERGSLTYGSARTRAEPDARPDQPKSDQHQADHSYGIEHRPVSTGPGPLSGSPIRPGRPPRSSLSSHPSYKSTPSEAESSFNDDENTVPNQETQFNAYTRINTTPTRRPTPPTGAGNRRLPYTRAEDDLLIRLREHEKLDWKEILPRLPGRSIGSISGHYSELRARRHGPQSKQYTSQQGSSGPAISSASYSREEDERLIKLREVDKLDWNTILPYFPGRSMGSISGHYGQLKVKSSNQIPKPPMPAQHHSPNGNHGIPYSAEEDALLVRLKEIHNLNWDEIVPYFQGRTRGSLQVRYSSKLKSESKTQHGTVKPQPQPKPIVEHQKSSANHWVPYSAEEEALIVKLRGEGLSWELMVNHFKRRTAGALAVRYSSKLKDKPVRHHAVDDSDIQQASTEEDATTRPRRRRRHNGTSVLSGFISWADVKKSRQNVLEDEEFIAEDEQQEHRNTPNENSWKGTERAYSKSASRILRQREIGLNGGRSWSPSTRAIPDELKEHIFDDIGPQRFFHGTSGDVTCMAWTPEGDHFAAGSIAITDERSMQYNKPCNLLLGDAYKSVVYELPQHHVQRPINTDVGNVNSLHSMRETQDQRLFMTVGSVQFSPNGKTVYSAGMDGKARAYSIDSESTRTSCQYELEHPAAVYLLSVSNLDILATACHQAADGCVRIYKGATKFASLSPSRADSQTSRPIYPSTLKWGTSWAHSNLLLAGFSIDSFDEERNLAGETCLWDIQQEKRIEINAVTRNVFDVAWNPSPSSGSTAFAVASTPGVNKVNRGTRTVVQCFAQHQRKGGASSVLEFESRAFDINDLVYCPHDNNLIAAGATDGKVYVWDQRWAKSGSAPLHVLAHDHSLNVLDHDRERELADTGVRFLSWGATSSRLYSGSSDGVVKVWNPYRSTSEAHIKNIATFTSAVMSGAFSPDYRDLLIGEDQGRINLLGVRHGNQSIRSMDRFELRQADTSKHASAEYSNGRTVARALLETGQIELRPMGALSKRQAVQGPNYTGPYLAPSSRELREAEVEYQVALNMQDEEYSKAEVNASQSSDVGQALRESDKRVQLAQEKLDHLQSRLDDSEALRPQAAANQQRLRMAEEEQSGLEASLSSALEQCKLDCNYMPTNVGEDGEVTDSQRSERRVPAALWKVSEMNTNMMDANDLFDAGLTSRCATCQKPAHKPKTGLPTCESCARKRLGITATCEICSSPTWPTLEAKTPNLCERCNFSCFRCGEPAVIAPDTSKISCYKCDLSWTAGVLGYELANTRKVTKASGGRRTFDAQWMNDEEMTG